MKRLLKTGSTVYVSCSLIDWSSVKRNDLLRGCQSYLLTPWIYPVQLISTVNAQNFDHKLPVKKAQTNSTDPNQTASEETVWSGSSLFGIQTSLLWLPALETNILFKNKNRKVFEILEHLPNCGHFLSKSHWVADKGHHNKRANSWDFRP